MVHIFHKYRNITRRSPSTLFRDCREWGKRCSVCGHEDWDVWGYVDFPVNTNVDYTKVLVF